MLKGYFYVYLCDDDIIKVGSSITPERRLSVQANKKKYNISSFVSDMFTCESKLISSAREMCGPPIKGREFFSGSENVYNILCDKMKELCELYSDKVPLACDINPGVIFGSTISICEKTGMLSVTDMLRGANSWRRDNGLSPLNITSWRNNDSTREFIAELKIKYGEVLIMGRGRGNHTWAHPLLFIDLALSLNPEFKIEMYEWLYYYINNNIEEPDSYKLMCGSLYLRHPNKQSFPKYITDLAIKIKHVCRVLSWEEATEQQLADRNKLHSEIALLSDVLNSNDHAIRLAFERAKVKP